MKEKVEKIISESGHTDMFTMSVRLDPETKNTLNEIIDKERLKNRRASLNSLIQSILKNFIREYKEQK